MSNQISYTSEALYHQQLESLVLGDEDKEKPYNSLFSCESKPENSSMPIGTRRKLPPFKGWEALGL